MLPALFKSVWNYREFVLSSVKREFQIQFSRSLLGALWVVIHPLSQVLIFTLVLSQVMQMRLPAAAGGADGKYAYSIYLMSGVACWTLFSEALNRCTQTFVQNGEILKKIAFPRICLPMVSALMAAVNHSILLALVLVMLLATGAGLGTVTLAIIPVALLTLWFAVSVGMLLGVANVFFRDVGHLLGVVLQVWFWLTPIVYVKDILPQWVQEWIVFNPALPLVEAYHAVLYAGQWPDWASLVPLVVASALFSALALLTFRRASADLVDAL